MDDVGSKDCSVETLILADEPVEQNGVNNTNNDVGEMEARFFFFFSCDFPKTLQHSLS